MLEILIENGLKKVYVEFVDGKRYYTNLLGGAAFLQDHVLLSHLINKYGSEDINYSSSLCDMKGISWKNIETTPPKVLVGDINLCMMAIFGSGSYRYFNINDFKNTFHVLLENGSDPTTVTSDKQNILHFCLFYGSINGILSEDPFA
jgi:ankyrin repeat protein